MPSIWFKISSSKIPHLKFCRFFRQSVTKIMGKTAIWTILCFSPLPPINNVEEQWAKTCVKPCYRFATLHRGRRGAWNTLFKIPLIFCHDCSWVSECFFFIFFLRKRLVHFLCMWLVKIMLFVPVGKRSNSRSQMFYKIENLLISLKML